MLRASLADLGGADGAGRQCTRGRHEADASRGSLYFNRCTQFPADGPLQPAFKRLGVET